MRKITLSEAALAMKGECSFDGSFDSVCIDSREITPGCLFFAIKGDNFDGHVFVRTALEKGAAAAVCSEPVDCEGAVIRVDDTRKAFLALAGYYRAMFDIPVVGLTGSVGKTTTKDMTAAVIGSVYKTLATQGNLNNDIGLPRMCFRLDETYEAAVLEMGMNHRGEISLLTNVARPSIGMITNIGVSHIENLGSREGILEAKLEILEGMQPDAPLVLNADNDLLGAAAAAIERPVYTYGIESDADMRAVDIVEGSASTCFTLVYGEEQARVELPVLGRHNVSNACAAALCGRLLGISLEQAAAALADYVPDARRQKIVEHGGITVIEDCYNASPDSVGASLGVLCQVAQGRKIAVLADMLELGDHARAAHTQCGEKAAELSVDILLAYGENARFYVEGAKGVEARLYSDKSELTHELFGMLRAGDTVLFKGSRGMKLEECVEKLYRLIDGE